MKKKKVCRLLHRAVVVTVIPALLFSEVPITAYAEEVTQVECTEEISEYEDEVIEEQVEAVQEEQAEVTEEIKEDEEEIESNDAGDSSGDGTGDSNEDVSRESVSEESSGAEDSESIQSTGENGSETAGTTGTIEEASEESNEEEHPELESSEIVESVTEEVTEEVLTTEEVTDIVEETTTEESTTEEETTEEVTEETTEVITEEVILKYEYEYKGNDQHIKRVVNNEEVETLTEDETEEVLEDCIYGEDNICELCGHEKEIVLEYEYEYKESNQHIKHCINDDTVEDVVEDCVFKEVIQEDTEETLTLCEYCGHEEEIMLEYTYELLEEVSFDYKQGSGDDLVIHLDAPYNEFIGVSLGGYEIEQDYDYSVEEGSTIVTIFDDLLDAYPTGEYELEINFENYQYTTVLELLEKEVVREYIDWRASIESRNLLRDGYYNEDDLKNHYLGETAEELVSMVHDGFTSYDVKLKGTVLKDLTDNELWKIIDNGENLADYVYSAIKQGRTVGDIVNNPVSLLGIHLEKREDASIQLGSKISTLSIPTISDTSLMNHSVYKLAIDTDNTSAYCLQAGKHYPSGAVYSFIGDSTQVIEDNTINMSAVGLEYLCRSFNAMANGAFKNKTLTPDEIMQIVSWISGSISNGSTSSSSYADFKAAMASSYAEAVYSKNKTVTLDDIANAISNQDSAYKKAYEEGSLLAEEIRSYSKATVDFYWDRDVSNQIVAVLSQYIEEELEEPKEVVVGEGNLGVMGRTYTYMEMVQDYVVGLPDWYKTYTSPSSGSGTLGIARPQAEFVLTAGIEGLPWYCNQKDMIARVPDKFDLDGDGIKFVEGDPSNQDYIDTLDYALPIFGDAMKSGAFDVTVNVSCGSMVEEYKPFDVNASNRGATDQHESLFIIRDATSIYSVGGILAPGDGAEFSYDDAIVSGVIYPDRMDLGEGTYLGQSIQINLGALLPFMSEVVEGNTCSMTITFNLSDVSKLGDNVRYFYNTKGDFFELTGGEWTATIDITRWFADYEWQNSGWYNYEPEVVIPYTDIVPTIKYDKNLMGKYHMRDQAGYLDYIADKYLYQGWHEHSLQRANGSYGGDWSFDHFVNVYLDEARTQYVGQVYMSYEDDGAYVVWEPSLTTAGKHYLECCRLTNQKITNPVTFAEVKDTLASTGKLYYDVDASFKTSYVPSQGSHIDVNSAVVDGVSYGIPDITKTLRGSIYVSDYIDAEDTPVFRVVGSIDVSKTWHGVDFLTSVGNGFYIEAKLPDSTTGVLSVSMSVDYPQYEADDTIKFGDLLAYTNASASLTSDTGQSLSPVVTSTTNTVYITPNIQSYSKSYESAEEVLRDMYRAGVREIYFPVTWRTYNNASASYSPLKAETTYVTVKLTCSHELGTEVSQVSGISVTKLESVSGYESSIMSNDNGLLTFIMHEGNTTAKSYATKATIYSEESKTITVKVYNSRRAGSTTGAGMQANVNGTTIYTEDNTDTAGSYSTMNLTMSLKQGYNDVTFIWSNVRYNGTQFVYVDLRPYSKSEATCTEDGVTGYVCKACGILCEEKVTPALTHNWVEQPNDYSVYYVTEGLADTAATIQNFQKDSDGYYLETAKNGNTTQRQNYGTMVVYAKKACTVTMNLKWATSNTTSLYVNNPYFNNSYYSNYTMTKTAEGYTLTFTFPSAGCLFFEVYLNTSNNCKLYFPTVVSGSDATCTDDAVTMYQCSRCFATSTVAQSGTALGHDYQASVYPTEITKTDLTNASKVTLTKTDIKHDLKIDYSSSTQTVVYTIEAEEACEYTFAYKAQAPVYTVNQNVICRVNGYTQWQENFLFYNDIKYTTVSLKAGTNTIQLDMRLTNDLNSGQEYGMMDLTNNQLINMKSGVGHLYLWLPEPEIEPTCLEHGGVYLYCTRCLERSSITSTPALGHDYKLMPFAEGGGDSSEWTIDITSITGGTVSWDEATSTLTFNVANVNCNIGAQLVLNLASDYSGTVSFKNQSSYFGMVCTGGSWGGPGTQVTSKFSGGSSSTTVNWSAGSIILWVGASDAYDDAGTFKVTLPGFSVSSGEKTDDWYIENGFSKPCTDTEDGFYLYQCTRDPSHYYIEVIPAGTVTKTTRVLQFTASRNSNMLMDLAMIFEFNIIGDWDTSKDAPYICDEAGNKIGDLATGSTVGMNGCYDSDSMSIVVLYGSTVYIGGIPDGASLQFWSAHDLSGDYSKVTTSGMPCIMNEGLADTTVTVIDEDKVLTAEYEYNVTVPTAVKTESDVWAEVIVLLLCIMVIMYLIYDKTKIRY